MGFSRQEYWSGFPCPSSGDLPDAGIKSRSLTSPALAGGFFTTSATWEDQAPWIQYCLLKLKTIIRSSYYILILQIRRLGFHNFETLSHCYTESKWQNSTLPSDSWPSAQLRTRHSLLKILFSGTHHYNSKSVNTTKWSSLKKLVIIHQHRVSPLYWSHSPSSFLATWPLYLWVYFCFILFVHCFVS